ARIEVWELVDPIQNIGYELLQEQSWRNTDFSAKVACYSRSKVCNVGIINYPAYSPFLRRTCSIEVSHPSPYLHQLVVGESREAYLDCSWVIEACIRGEVCSQSLR